MLNPNNTKEVRFLLNIVYSESTIRSKNALFFASLSLLLYNSFIMPNRTNEAWLSDLATPGPAREAALEDLRVIIQKGLPYALSRWLSPDQPQFNSLVEEVTQETLLRVLDQLSTFEDAVNSPPGSIRLQCGSPSRSYAAKDGAIHRWMS